MECLGYKYNEEAKIEQVIREFFTKTLHIILDARSVHNNYVRNSGLIRSRDKWFNLGLRECKAFLESIHDLDLGKDDQLDSVVVVVVVDVILTTHNGNSSTNKIIIERWILQHQTTVTTSIQKWLSKKIYKRCVVMLRCLYTLARLLPAHNLLRDLNCCMYEYDISHKISSFADPFTRAEESKMRHYAFTPLATDRGHLCLSVSYLSKLEDYVSPQISVSTQFITDYFTTSLVVPLNNKFQFQPLPISQPSTTQSEVIPSVIECSTVERGFSNKHLTNKPTPNASIALYQPEKLRSTNLPNRITSSSWFSLDTGCENIFHFVNDDNNIRPKISGEEDTSVVNTSKSTGSLIIQMSHNAGIGALVSILSTASHLSLKMRTQAKDMNLIEHKQYSCEVGETSVGSQVSKTKTLGDAIQELKSYRLVKSLDGKNIVQAHLKRDRLKSDDVLID